METSILAAQAHMYLERHIFEIDAETLELARTSLCLPDFLACLIIQAARFTSQATSFNVAPLSNEVLQVDMLALAPCTKISL